MPGRARRWPGRTGVVYLTITDTGAPDRLTGASSPVAAKATLHESTDDHGVMKMRPVAALPVQPGKPVKLAPGGYHIMLEGLKQPLQPGETFPVTLTFANAGTITATATVQKGGAAWRWTTVRWAACRCKTVAAGHAGRSPPAAMPGMTMGGTPQH